MEKIDSKENFIRLVQQYRNLVFSICLKLTGDYFAAEDLTQETFLSAYRHLEEFDGREEKAWLCRIAGNKCVDYLRAAARRVVPTEEEELQSVAGAVQDESLSRVLNREILEQLHAACKALKPPYREVALAHFAEGKTAGEIAAENGTTVSTVKTRIYRAREMLKKSMGKGLLKNE